MAELTDPQRQSIAAAIFAGQKIEAIKLHREVTGVGLAEAKAAVETMEAKLRAEQPGKFTTQARKTGCIGLIAVIGLVLALMGVGAALAWSF